jgi:hypothetical protein
VALGLAALSHPSQAQETPGKGSLGGTIGVPIILSDQDLSTGLRPRLMLKLHFQYVMTPAWRVSVRGGFGWTGYASDVLAPYPFPSSSGGYDTTKVDQLTYLYPLSAGVDYVRSLDENWRVLGGVGFGVYNVTIVNDRNGIQDPVTRERYSLWSPGFTLEAGGEYSLPANRNVGFEGIVTFHQMLHGDDLRYPSGFTGPHSFLDINFGVNVYFWPPGSEPQVTPALGEEEEETEPSPPPEPEVPEEPKSPETP